MKRKCVKCKQYKRIEEFNGLKILKQYNKICKECEWIHEGVKYTVDGISTSTLQKEIDDFLTI